MKRPQRPDLVSTILAFYRHNLRDLIVDRRKLLGRQTFLHRDKGGGARLSARLVLKIKLAGTGDCQGISGPIVHRRFGEKTQARRVKFGAAAIAVCLATACLLSACSPGADYP